MTWLMALIGFLALALLRGAPGANPQACLGAPPQDTWNGPVSHPIKGHVTTDAGEPCIDHGPGGRFSATTTPERGDAPEDEAQQDGCRRSKRSAVRGTGLCRLGIHGEIRT
jgi:hypothetical protein